VHVCVGPTHTSTCNFPRINHASHPRSASNRSMPSNLRDRIMTSLRQDGPVRSSYAMRFTRRELINHLNRPRPPTRLRSDAKVFIRHLPSTWLRRPFYFIMHSCRLPGLIDLRNNPDLSPVYPSILILRVTLAVPIVRAAFREG